MAVAYAWACETSDIEELDKALTCPLGVHLANTPEEKRARAMALGGVRI